MTKKEWISRKSPRMTFNPPLVHYKRSDEWIVGFVHNPNLNQS
ncbi:MAG: hypothetical protein O6830_00625 [Candidatus Dadabacteria bacterium]|nr:hypothetical protein [Candidatus Dadabacteria bacterium]